ncbi:DegT/DnrJ/EryC1/StrS family aminotransferase [Amylibacter sp.]|nr:DegT/DnrJ/EryC1/StrS family aminotransferase [Amylibacter sp.]
MNWKIQLSELNYNEQEAQAVQRILQSEWLTAGPETSQFELEFSSYLMHDNQGVFVSSATAGLHLILMAIGVEAGDEVILPAVTFVSDANVVVQLGAKPVFADSNSLFDFNVSIDSIVTKINQKTKAIIIVHFAGYPMDLTALRKVCDHKGIALIEDCAHAPGAKYAGTSCGTVGHFSFFSFFSNKNLAVGEGGMVFSEDETLGEIIRLKRSHGMSAPTLDRHLGRVKSYDVVSYGLNYRPDEIRAALGRVQLEKLDASNERRKKLSEGYTEILNTDKLILPFAHINGKSKSVCHIFPIILPETSNRSEVMQFMKEKGIQTSIHYPSFKSFTAYKEFTRDLISPVADILCERELTLPLHPRMSFDDIDYVSRSLIEAI